jgi:ABC-2 type transport system permease protein
MGCFFLFSFALNTTVTVQLTFYFTYFIFMLASTLISDFTSVLIDIRDNYIILPKPVNDRTMLLARLLHIFIHICKLVVPMLLPALIYIGIEFGIAGWMLLVVAGILAVIFSIFLINAVYIIILRITTPEKFKAIISYIQIVFAVVLYASFQLLPRMMGNIENFDLHFSNSNWLLLLPSYWFAAAWNVMYNLNGSLPEYIAAVCACLIPFVSLWIVIRFLAPSFNSKLSLISNTGNDAAPVLSSAHKTSDNKTTFSNTIAKLFSKPGTERMGFLFTWYMMARSRDFKMKVYPAIGYLLVYIFIFFFNTKSFGLADIEQQTKIGKIVIITVLYFSSFLLSTAIAQLVFSDKYKAAWFYFITPINVPGSIITGSVKAAVAKFFLPLFIALSILGIAITGISFIPNLILSGVNQLTICYLLVYFGNKEFPFSKTQSIQVKTGNFIRSLFRMILPISIAVLHYVIYTSIPLIIIFLIISIAALRFIMDSVKRLSWNVVTTTYTEE